MRKIILSLMFLFFIIFIFYYFINKDIYFDWEYELVISKWETFNDVLLQFSEFDKLSFNLYWILNDLPDDIRPWLYTFSWSYSKSDFFDSLKSWPETVFIDIRLLEWWSSYDVDYYLYSNDYIDSWDYVNFIKNEDIISSYKDRYDFLEKNNDIEILEWYLYPDTYRIDISKDIIDQLVYLQLENFKNRIWDKYGEDFFNFNDNLSQAWYSYEFEIDDIITLASIVEKEENNDENKPLISWIFINRLDSWRRLDADISLCYWLWTWYINCTVDDIVANLNDSSNLYNTRQNSWLTPTAIVSPHISSIDAVLNFENTDYYFYLHDNSWNLHPSKNNQEHNIKRSQYLNN